MPITNDMKNTVELEIGAFDVLAESSKNKFLIKSSNGFYYFLWNERSLILEDVTWAISKVLNRKRKIPYKNGSSLKKEKLTNGTRQY